MKIAPAIPILSGGAAIIMMTAAPALAGQAGPGQPRAGQHAVRSILQNGTAVTGVRGSGGRGVTGSTFYGPDTHLFNPRAIPRGDVRAVGSYLSSDAPPGVRNQGMIYRVMGLYVNSANPADRTYLAVIAGR